MNRLDVANTPLVGLHRIISRRLGDQRGHLMRVFCQDELRPAGWNHPIAQANVTHTRRKGTVRGLHFQRPPHAEVKLVRCLQGEVWDVVVDLRRDSATFLQWHAERLSEDNATALLIPEGFAHGFQTLTDDVAMLYLHSRPHAPESEGGLHVSDPTLELAWPLPIEQMSDRDRALPFLSSGCRKRATPMNCRHCGRLLKHVFWTSASPHPPTHI